MTDQDMLKDIAFVEAAITAAGRDPKIEEAVMSKEALLNYVSNVQVFKGMTSEQFFTDAPYQGYARQIRTMREAYEASTATEAETAKATPTLESEVASLRAQMKELTETLSTPEPAPAASVTTTSTVAVVSDAEPNPDETPEADPETEE